MRTALILGSLMKRFLSWSWIPNRRSAAQVTRAAPAFVTHSQEKDTLCLRPWSSPARTATSKFGSTVRSAKKFNRACFFG